MNVSGPSAHARLLAALLVLGAGGTLRSNAQVIFGRVVDAGDGSPLEGAHVFISGSLIGTVAGENGLYRLDGVPQGSHRIVGSMLGFETASVDTVLTTPDLEVNLRLEERVLEAGQIEVVARDDDKWLKNLQRFEREFLGRSAAALGARILNPEVLDFDSRWWGRLEATATGPLVVENPHLGYTMTYHLKDYRYTPSILRYDGDPVFEEMEAENDEERQVWEANRQAAFGGSFRHFLLALMVDSTEAQGFRTFRRPSLDNPTRSQYRFPVDPQRLVDGRDSSGVRLRFTGFVEIIYENEDEEVAYLKQQGIRRRPGPQQSWIKLSDGPTVVDWLGSVIDPYGITVYGYLAFERVGDELPKEYRPPGVHLNPKQ